MLNLKLRTLEGTWPRTSVGICARMAWVSMEDSLWQPRDFRPGGVSLGVRWMDATCARRGIATSTANRAAASKSRLLGMLAGNASEHASSVRQAWASDAGNRHCASTGFVQKNTSPAWGSKGGVSRRRSAGRPAPAHRHRRPACARRRARPVQHVHEGFRHALLAMLCISRLAVMPSTARRFSSVQRGDQLQPDGRAVRDAEGDEQEQRRRGDVRQFGEEAVRRRRGARC